MFSPILNHNFSQFLYQLVENALKYCIGASELGKTSGEQVI